MRLLDISTPKYPNKFAQVDDDLFDELNRFKWYASERNGTFYASRRGPRPEKKMHYMHREILNPPKGMVVDHIDGDGLNNQRENLRICTHQQNIFNSKKRSDWKLSPYKGVSLHRASGKFSVRISTGKRSRYIGLFPTELEAKAAWEKIASEYQGEFARASACGAPGRSGR